MANEFKMGRAAAEFGRTEKQKNIWELSQKRFNEMVSKVTTTWPFINLFIYGPWKLSDEDVEFLRRKVSEYGIRLDTDEDLVAFSTDLNERLFSP